MAYRRIVSLALHRVLAALFCIATAPAAAEEIELFPAPYDFALKEPADPPAPGGPATYAVTSAGAAWGIAAWNIPGPRLPPFVAGGGVFQSTTPAAGLRIVQAGGRARYNLSQDGRELPCDNAAGRPREFDLFVAPEGPPAAGLPSLGEMHALLQSAEVTIRSGPAIPAKGCAVSQGSALLALVLSNTLTRQTLFYQLRLSLVCGPAPSCRATIATPRLGYFARANPFGIDDYLPLAGGAWLQDGTPAALRLDLRPRLLAALRQAPPGLDADPAHWRLTRAYHGQHIWGDVMLQSSWAEVRLRAVR